MKKVKLFIGRLSTGGAERVVSNLSIYLSENIRKDIIMFGGESRIDYPYNGELVYLDKSQPINLLTKFIVVGNRIISVKRIKETEQDATIISFLEYPNLINVLTSNFGKSIISVRNHMSTKHNRGIKSKLWNATIKYLYPKADFIISVSKEIKRDLIENYKIDEDKIKVIYNSYDIEEINGLAKEDIEDEYKEIFKVPVIITAGRLNKQKGQWHLIRAFSEVKKQIPNAKLVVLGEGNLENYLRELAKGLNIGNDVHFLGFQKNPFKFIARSEMFVMSSLHEGFPNALAEAMACGIPVVSSDCLSGPREILAPDEFDVKGIDYRINEDEDRYGVLIPVCDGNRYSAIDPITKEEFEMSDSMISLLKNKELWDYYSKQSSLRIQDFKISNIIKEWESVI